MTLARLAFISLMRARCCATVPPDSGASRRGYPQARAASAAPGINQPLAGRRL